MPAAKRKKSSQPLSQGSDNPHHTTVSTPEIEVSLVDRMKKRFSTRQQISSDPTSDADLEHTGASQSDENPTDTGARRRPAKRNSLGQKVTRIDKFFSPDTRSSKVFRSPTRFPSETEKLALAAAGSESDEEGNDTQTGPKQAETRSSSNTESDHSDNDGQQKASSSSDEKSRDKTVHSQDATHQRQEATPGENASQQKASDSGINQRGGLSEAGSADDSDRAGSAGEVPGGSSQETPVQRNRDKEPPSHTGDTHQDSGRSTRKSTKTKGKGNAVMASGEVEAHMADREFISNQVRVMSTPFVLESGPRSWMQIWKAQQSSHDVDPPDIPSSVIDRIVTKINFHMEDVYGRLLGRQQQRNTLMGLDELRKAAQDDSQSKLSGDIVPSQASLEEIISCYPSVWADSINEEDAEMAERYSSLWARLFALNQSLSVNKKQYEQYKLLVDTLERIDTNLDTCSPEEFEKEVQRTGELVLQIKEKLEGNAIDVMPPESERNIRDSSNESPSPFSAGNHSALVKLLFKAAAQTEST